MPWCVFCEKVSTAIQSDVQALIWGKDVQFDPEELGHGKVRRYMKMNAQYRRRNGGGLGLIHWESHLKGLTDITLIPVLQRQVHGMEAGPGLVVRQAARR